MVFRRCVVGAFVVVGAIALSDCAIVPQASQVHAAPDARAMAVAVHWGRDGAGAMGQLVTTGAAIGAILRSEEQQSRSRMGATVSARPTRARAEGIRSLPREQIHSAARSTRSAQQANQGSSGVRSSRRGVRHTRRARHPMGRP